MIIKKCLIILSLLFAIACSNEEKAIIKGEIENIDSEEISYLEEIRVSGNRIIDSARIKSNGKFRYPVKLNKPGFYQLTIADDYTLALIVSPGEKIEIQGNIDDFYASKRISGSPNSEKVNVLHDSLRKTITYLDELRYVYAYLSDTLPDFAEQQQFLDQQFTILKSDYHNYSVRHLLNDLKSLTGIAALYQEYAPNEFVFNKTRDLQYFKLVSDTLSKYYPAMRHVKALKQYYSGLISEYNKKRILQAKEHISSDVPNLVLPSVTGKPISLSSLTGKFVLLSFWSYDHPESIQNTIELKKVYSKYKDAGFEIYQVSVDHSFEMFVRKVAFEEIQWISVIDTTFPDSKTRYIYNVNALPMNYLINKDQTEIISKNISPELLEQSLQYLLTRND